MKRVVLVLKSGGDFAFEDVRLISRHIRNKWKSQEELDIVCFWDKALLPFALNGFRVLPLDNDYHGVWSRIDLYSDKPEIVDLRPFLYIDLDTAIIHSVENLFKVVEKYENNWITLEDFWQSGRLATGLVWFPKHSHHLDLIWETWKKTKYPLPMKRMDYFLRTITSADVFWQDLTDTVYGFKPRAGLEKYLVKVPQNANVVCFHGHPRLPQADFVDWVSKYLKE
jgi:hypothetical protein